MLISDSNLISAIYRKITNYIDQNSVISSGFYVNPLDGHLYINGNFDQVFYIDNNGHLCVYDSNK